MDGGKQSLDSFPKHRLGLLLHRPTLTVIGKDLPSQKKEKSCIMSLCCGFWFGDAFPVLVTKSWLEKPLLYCKYYFPLRIESPTVLNRLRSKYLISHILLCKSVGIMKSIFEQKKILYMFYLIGFTHSPHYNNSDFLPPNNRALAPKSKLSDKNT